MTEAEWGSATDREQVLAFLGKRLSNRKRRLFACACCRRYWYWVVDTDAARAIEVAEAYADGRATDKKLEAAANAANETSSRLYQDYRQTHGLEPYIAHIHAGACASAASDGRDALYANSAANFIGQTYAYETMGTNALHDDVWKSHKADEAAVQTALLRDIAGNPFRPVAFNPIWRTSDVLLLARGIYDDRAFDRMPILADALQDAGCDASDLLTHLRDPALLPWERSADTTGPAPVAHVRGCWALDLVLGRE